MMYYSKHYHLVRSTHRDLCVRDRKMANDFRLKLNWTSQRCLTQKSSSVRLDGLQRLAQAWWGWMACEGHRRHLLWLPWKLVPGPGFHARKGMPMLCLATNYVWCLCAFFYFLQMQSLVLQWDFRKQGGGGGGGRLVGLTLELGQADASDFVSSV